MVSYEYLNHESFLCAFHFLILNNTVYAFEGQDLIKYIIVTVPTRTLLSAPGISFLPLITIGFATVNTVKKKKTNNILVLIGKYC